MAADRSLRPVVSVFFNQVETISHITSHVRRGGACLRFLIRSDLIELPTYQQPATTDVRTGRTEQTTHARTDFTDRPTDHVWPDYGGAVRFTTVPQWIAFRFAAAIFALMNGPDCSVADKREAY